VSVTFLIPGPLRPYIGGRSQVNIQASGSTVRDAFETLCMLYPGLRDRIATEQGQIRQHINVFVGSEDIRYTGGLATPISDGAQISIVPSISGG
jgi:sulfur-carrier protein